MHRVGGGIGRTDSKVIKMEITSPCRTRGVVSEVKESYKSRDLADVKFLVGTPPVTFRCHKKVLSQASDVFNRMFYGGLPEKETVKIEDVDKEAFRILLKYIYTQWMSIPSLTMALNTAYACKKYMMPKFVFDLCMIHAENYLDLEDLWYAFEVAVLLEDRRLYRLCKFLFIIRKKIVFKSKEFLQCSSHVLQKVVADIADHVDPVFLFTALVDWAEHQEKTPESSLRTLLEPFLPHIRFLAMPYKEYVRCVGLSFLLSNWDYATITTELLCGRDNRSSPLWLNRQRVIAKYPLEYRLVVTTPFTEYVYTESRDVHLAVSFQVLLRDAFLKGLYGKVNTDRLPSMATVAYLNHTKIFSVLIETEVEVMSHSEGQYEKEFYCRLKRPRLLERNDRVTLNIHLHSDTTYFTYKKGTFKDQQRYIIQGGQVVIETIPIHNVGGVSGVVLTPSPFL